MKLIKIGRIKRTTKVEYIKNIIRSWVEAKKTLLVYPNINLSSVDKHLFFNYLYEKRGHFHTHYREWTMRRINKILYIYGVEWFKNKKILVLGDGIGYVGSFFAEIGSKVLSLEGRRDNVNFAKLKYRQLKNFSIQEFDLENDFTHFGKFDLIINMGLIEVMPDSSNLLSSCIKMSNKVLIETLITDSNDRNYKHEVTWRRKGVNDISLNGKCMVPTTEFVKQFFVSEGFKLRKFSEGLNSGFHTYDWTPKNGKLYDEKQRIFWLFEK